MPSAIPGVIFSGKSGFSGAGLSGFSGSVGTSGFSGVGTSGFSGGSGSGSGTVSSATTGQVAFYTGSTTVGGDGNLFWNNSLKALCLGHSGTPVESIDVRGSGTNVGSGILTGNSDNSNYLEILSGRSGDTTSRIMSKNSMGALMLGFNASPGTTPTTTSITLLPNQAVGINQSSPEHILHVNALPGDNAVFPIFSSGSGNFIQLGSGRAGDQRARIMWRDGMNSLDFATEAAYQTLSTPQSVDTYLSIVNSDRSLRYYNGGGNYTGFKASGSANNTVFTLPASDGSSGQALTTNGSGVLSFGSTLTATYLALTDISFGRIATSGQFNFGNNDFVGSVRSLSINSGGAAAFLIQSPSTISNVALTSNVATITTSGLHNLAPGMIVKQTGLTTTALNGTWRVGSTPSSTTYTFSYIHADISSVGDSGTALGLPIACWGGDNNLAGQSWAWTGAPQVSFFSTGTTGLLGGSVEVGDGFLSVFKTQGGTAPKISLRDGTNAQNLWSIVGTSTSAFDIKDSGGTTRLSLDNAGKISVGEVSASGPLDTTSYIEQTQIATPSNPASGKNRLYFKSDDEVYRLNSAGIESLVGTGVSGFSGYSGVSGFSGESNISGFSGFSGVSGFSGKSGVSGFSGTSLPVAGSNGDIQYNNAGSLGASSDLNWNNGTSTLTVDGDAVITGKLTVDGPIDPTYIEQTQIATPGNPASGKNRLYFKSDNKIYKLNSAGTETEVGSGGGGSGTVSSATTGQIAFYTGSTTVGGEANLFWDSSNKFFGIGTSSPTQTFDLRTQGTNTACFPLFSNSDASCFFQLGSGRSGDKRARLMFNSTMDAMDIGYSNGIQPSGVTAIANFLPNGYMNVVSRLGIGTTTPNNQLHIVGDPCWPLFSNSDFTNYIQLGSGHGGDRRARLMFDSTMTHFAIGVQTALQPGAGVTNIATFFPSGNVEIAGTLGVAGATSPTEKLEVNGAIKIANAAGTANGTIRWTGSDFEGRKGGAWVSMTTGSTPTEVVNNDIALRRSGALGGEWVIQNNTITTNTLKLHASGRVWGFSSGALTITNVSLTSNVATITTNVAHGMAVGSIAVVNATTNTFFNGTFHVSDVPSSTTFSYPLTHTNVGSTSDTGSVLNPSTLMLGGVGGFYDVNVVGYKPGVAAVFINTIQPADIPLIVQSGIGTPTPVSVSITEWRDYLGNTLSKISPEGSFSTKGLSASISTQTGTYTATAADFTILCDATGGAFSVNLPAAASHPGRIYNIKKIDSSGNAVTIDGNSSETIDGATTLAISTQYQNKQIQSDGTAWYVL